MPTTLQGESSESVVARLAMIASAHRLRTDLTDLRRRFPISLKGATLAHLIRHADALGFAARPPARLASGTAAPLKAGMTLDAAVIQDRRRVIEWLFEPLIGAAQRRA